MSSLQLQHTLGECVTSTDEDALVEDRRLGLLSLIQSAEGAYPLVDKFSLHIFGESLGLSLQIYFDFIECLTEELGPLRDH